MSLAKTKRSDEPAVCIWPSFIAKTSRGVFNRSVPDFVVQNTKAVRAIHGKRYGRVTFRRDGGAVRVKPELKALLCQNYPRKQATRRFDNIMVQKHALIDWLQKIALPVPFSRQNQMHRCLTTKTFSREVCVLAEGLRQHTDPTKRTNACVCSVCRSLAWNAGE